MLTKPLSPDGYAAYVRMCFWIFSEKNTHHLSRAAQNTRHLTNVGLMLHDDDPAFSQYWGQILVFAGMVCTAQISTKDCDGTKR